MLNTTTLPSHSLALTGHEHLLWDRRVRLVRASREAVYEIFTGLGGERGWLHMNWAWWLRGLLDRWMGGPGLRKNRRQGHELREGDTVDCWRVETLAPPGLMRLRSEMKLPGRGWLEFEVAPSPGGCSRLTQTAYFEPAGLRGFLYWYSLALIHAVLFRGLIRKIAEKAEKHPCDWFGPRSGLASAPGPSSPPAFSLK